MNATHTLVLSRQLSPDPFLPSGKKCGKQWYLYLETNSALIDALGEGPQREPLDWGKDKSKLLALGVRLSKDHGVTFRAQ